MLDFSHIPNKNNTQVFTTPNTWQTWQKPRGAKVVHMLCIGGGNGGNGSPVGLNLGLSNGATGGTSSPFTQALFMANSLPNILHVYVGIGGKGGTTPTGGSPDNTQTQGGRSFITVSPIFNLSNIDITPILCMSATTNGIAGATTLGAVATTAVMPLIALAISFSTNSGQVGTNQTIDVTPTTIVTGGAGGGNRDTNGTNPGGVIMATGPIPGSPKIVGNSTTRVGPPGVVIYKPIFATTGGSGGQYANGGDAAYGSGGGGASGMGGASSSPGFSGGKGGDGIVIITTSI